jgi:hypothetical protein
MTRVKYKELYTELLIECENLRTKNKRDHDLWYRCRDQEEIIKKLEAKLLQKEPNLYEGLKIEKIIDQMSVDTEHYQKAYLHLKAHHDTTEHEILYALKLIQKGMEMEFFSRTLYWKINRHLCRAGINYRFNDRNKWGVKVWQRYYEEIEKAMKSVLASSATIGSR